MTAFQTFWTFLCTVVPAVYVGYLVNWWFGIAAYFAAILLGTLLGWVLVMTLPFKYLAIGGYFKNLAIAVAIIVFGYYFSG